MMRYGYNKAAVYVNKERGIFYAKRKEASQSAGK